MVLSAVGFDVLDVRHAAATEVDLRKDPSVLRWARRNKRILVCHDRHHGRGAVMLELADEMFHHGGRILQVTDGSDQEPLLALAKVLLHRSEWLAFFAKEKKGRVTVSKDRCKCTTARTLYTNFQYSMKLAAPDELAAVAPYRAERVRRPRRQAAGGVNLPEAEGGDSALGAPVGDLTAPRLRSKGGRRGPRPGPA